MKSVLRLFLVCAVTCWSITANGQSFNFIHNGISREYIYYEPANLSVNAPLVFVAHGYSGSAQDIRNYSGMNDIGFTRKALGRLAFPVTPLQSSLL